MAELWKEIQKLREGLSLAQNTTITRDPAEVG